MGLGRVKDKVVSPCTSCVLPMELRILEASSSQQKAKKMIGQVAHNLQTNLYFLQVQVWHENLSRCMTVNISSGRGAKVQ